MMGISDLKAAVMVVRTIREDWDRRAVEGQITELADNYDHPDVLYAAVVIARDLNNRGPTMLTIKAPDLLARLHAKTATVRTNGPARQKEDFLCDTCRKTQSQCQSDATNLDGEDHPFITIRQANEAREAQLAANNPERLEAKAEVARRWSGIGALPADVTSQTHPEPQQEEAAS